MAFDAVLAERVRDLLEPIGLLREIKMFGGLCFMHRGHMLCGLLGGDSLILRLGADAAAVIDSGQARAFEPMKGKPAAGMCVIPEAAELDDEPIKAWLDRAVAFVETLPPKG